MPVTPAAEGSGGGLTRRRNRLSDQETRARMLAAAQDVVERVGLTVSLDHISFEDVIREAGVARSTAYRAWPNKELFFADLVVGLAQTTAATTTRNEVGLVAEILSGFDGDLAEPAQRRLLMLEVTRQLIDVDQRDVMTSPGWRTYLALHSTVSSLAPGELRDRLRETLAQAESRRAATIRRVWAQITTLLGQRVRPELGSGLDDLVTLFTATMNGMLLAALADPAVVDRTVAVGPAGGPSDGPWSLTGFAFAALVEAFVEPDPDAVWDESMPGRLREALAAWSEPDPS